MRLNTIHWIFCISSTDVIILPIRTVALRLSDKFALPQFIYQIHYTKRGRRKIVFDFKMGWEIFSPPVASRPALKSTLCAIQLMQVAICPVVKQSWHDNHYPTVRTAEINRWSSFSASLHVVIGIVAELRAQSATPRSCACKIYRPFDVSVTVHHWYNNINSQLDATIIILLIISISSTCFGREFYPSSGALDCVYSLHRRCCLQHIVASSWLFILLYIGSACEPNSIIFVRNKVSLFTLWIDASNLLSFKTELGKGLRKNSASLKINETAYRQITQELIAV